MRSAGGKTEAELLVEHHLEELSLTPFEHEHRFHPSRRWRFDYAVPSLMLAVEIEGGIFSHGRHVRGVGYVNDLEKYNAATAMGWRVFRFHTGDIKLGRDLECLRLWVRGGER